MTRILLLGFGGVGRAFSDILEETRPALRARFGIEPRLVAIRRSELETTDPGDRAGSGTWRPVRELADTLHEVSASIVVQAVPGDSGGLGQASRDAFSSLAAGAHLVTATKTTLAYRWADLRDAAIAADRAVRVSAAAGAALPAVDLARRGLRGLGCRALRGSLNGTSNLVLNAMAAGHDLAGALAQARGTGIAEPGSDDDLSGADAAAKLVILANLTWGEAREVAEVTIEAIDATAARRAQDAARTGQALRAVASADGPRGALSVRLETIGADDPLHRLPGAEKAIVFDLGQAGTVVVAGGRSDPRSAALSLVKDVVNLATGDERPGIE